MECRVTRAWSACVVCLAGVLATAAGEPARDLLEATCRLANRSVSATCFLVTPTPAPEAGRPNLVLVTAAHFLEGTPESECQWVVRTTGPNGLLVRREVPLPIRNGEAPRWTRHPEVDIAALPVEAPEGFALRPFLMEQLAGLQDLADGRVRVGQDVLIAGYPARLEANEAGWPILRKGMIATYPLLPLAAARTLFVDADTFGGDSGGPVALAAGPELLVIGVVVGMQRQTDRSAMPFEEKTVHMPLGLAIVVQAAFVRETVGSLGR